MQASRTLHVFTVWNGPAVLITKSAPTIHLSIDLISFTSHLQNISGAAAAADELFLEATVIEHFLFKSEKAFCIAVAALDPTLPVPPTMTIFFIVSILISSSIDGEDDDDDEQTTFPLLLLLLMRCL